MDENKKAIIDERRKTLRRQADKEDQKNLQFFREHIDKCQSMLEESERIKPLATVASTVVHDIRNSLGVISSTAQFVLNNLKPSEKERQSWQLVDRNVENIKNMLTNYLGLARQAGGSSTELTSLNEAVTRVCHFIDSQSRDRNVKVIKNLGESIPKIPVNIHLIESAILNICINALDSMNDPGTLKLTTKKNKDSVILEVEDTGHGIKPELIDKIFSPFFTTKKEGTGMGLFSARNNIEQSNGKIACESTVGKGTKMIVSFPAKIDSTKSAKDKR